MQCPWGVPVPVRLNGETWLIRRSFNPFKEDYALRGPSLAEIAEFLAEPTGMQPFRDAATQAFLSDGIEQHGSRLKVPSGRTRCPSLGCCEPHRRPL
jgi:hypothetical protein